MMAQWTLISNYKDPYKFCFYLVAAMAPWFCLHLPFCGPEFESQAHHLRFFQFVLLKLYQENNENKQKEAGICPFFLKKNLKLSGCSALINCLLIILAHVKQIILHWWSSLGSGHSILYLVSRLQWWSLMTASSTSASWPTSTWTSSCPRSYRTPEKWGNSSWHRPQSWYYSLTCAWTSLVRMNGIPLIGL